jgi:hypothetical protein
MLRVAATASLIWITACGTDGSGKPVGADGDMSAIDAAIDAVPPECLAHADCADPAEPACDPVLHECRPCARSNECSTGICDEEQGTCIPPSEIYYVDDDAACAEGDGTPEHPYCTVEDAMTRFLGEPRNFVHFLDGVYPSLRMAWTSPPVFSGADTARLTPSPMDGRCASVDAAATGVFRGFQFVDCPVALAARGPARNIYVHATSIQGGGTAIECEEYCQISATTIVDVDRAMSCLGFGVCEVRDVTITGAATFGASATGGASLLVERTEIRDTGRKAIVVGGGELVVRDSLIDGAGVTMVDAGIECGGGSTCTIQRTRVRGATGAGIALLDPTSWTIENSAIFYNGQAMPGAIAGGVWIQAPLGSGTFEHNTVVGNQPSGVRCTGAHLVNSIVWGNVGTQVDGCTADASDIDQDGVSGTGNFRQDPLLGGTPPLAIDHHLQPGSPCVNTAVGSTMTDDIDGQARDAMPDVGADELDAM